MRGAATKVIASLLLLLTTWPASAGPAEEYIDAQLAIVRDLERQLPFSRIEAAADRLCAGGSLYLAGEPGMVSELHGRAGGLCGARRFAPGKTLLAKGDVVLASHYSDAASILSRWRAVRGTGALFILTCPGHHPELNNPRVTGPAGAVRLQIPLDNALAPFPASPAHSVAQWAIVAELIGACRRRGRQLAVYLSIHLDEGRKRYARTKGLLFEPELKPGPVPKGQYAKAFLDRVRGALEAVRRDEIGAIRKAAGWVREAKTAGRKTVRHLYAHLPPHEAGAPWDPGCFSDTVRGPLGEPGAERIRKSLAKGDVYLLVGYQQSQDAMAAAANAVGARTVFMTSLPPGKQQAANPSHLYVSPHWPLTDACLELPGYDVKACPLSAICGLTCYYAIAAEAAGR